MTEISHRRTLFLEETGHQLDNSRESLWRGRIGPFCAFVYKVQQAEESF